MVSGKETTCFWRVVFVHDFLPPQWALLPQSWRWGDVGHSVFLFCCGLNGHRDPPLVRSSTQSCFVVTQSLCVASPLDSPQPRRFSGWIFSFFATLKKGSKTTFWVRYVLGPGFLGCSTQRRPYFAAFYELGIRYVLGPRVLLCFWGPSFLFFDRVKDLIWGVGKKNAARAIWALWLGPMTMGASWDVLIFHADTRGRDCQCHPKIKQQLHGRPKCNAKHVHTTGWCLGYRAWQTHWFRNLKKRDRIQRGHLTETLHIQKNSTGQEK